MNNYNQRIRLKREKTLPNRLYEQDIDLTTKSIEGITPQKDKPQNNMHDFKLNIQLYP